MKHVVLTTLLLFIFGIIIVGCRTIVDPEMRRGLNSEFLIEKYTGPQTVKALMEVFDARYSSRTVNTKWNTASESSYGEKRHLEFTLADMDAKYPRQEWLQMLLNKGITIEDFETYSEYLSVRSDLILKEFHTKDDWETVKVKYVDTQIQKYQDKQASQGVEGWVVLGENRLPVIPRRMYVQKTESGARIWHTTRSTSKSWDGKTEILSVKGTELSEKQKSDLLNNGVEPVGWEVVYLDEKGNYAPQDK